MSAKKNKRRLLREKALQVLYAFEMNKEGLDRLTEDILINIESKI